MIYPGGNHTDKDAFIIDREYILIDGRTGSRMRALWKGSGTIAAPDGEITGYFKMLDKDCSGKYPGPDVYRVPNDNNGHDVLAVYELLDNEYNI